MFKFLRRLILVLFVLFAGYKIYQVHHDVKQVMKYQSLVREVLDEQDTAANAELVLAMIYTDQGDFHKALKLIEDEEKIVEEHFPNDNLKKAVNNYEQGYVRFKLNNLDEALTFMNLSLEQSLETDDVISQACSYRGLGEIYSALEDTELSNTHFKQAIELFESVGEFEAIKEIEELINE